jgi:acyl-CoA thioester hydrolase
MDLMREQYFGPVLFREECTFRREITLDDVVFVDLEVRSISADRSRFSFVHTFSKADGTHCAKLIVEGAWMNTRTRKLTAPPEMALHILERIPHTAEDASSAP